MKDFLRSRFPPTRGFLSVPLGLLLSRSRRTLSSRFPRYAAFYPTPIISNLLLRSQVQTQLQLLIRLKLRALSKLKSVIKSKPTSTQIHAVKTACTPFTTGFTRYSSNKPTYQKTLLQAGFSALF